MVVLVMVSRFMSKCVNNKDEKKALGAHHALILLTYTYTVYCYTVYLLMC